MLFLHAGGCIAREHQSWGGGGHQAYAINSRFAWLALRRKPKACDVNERGSNVWGGDSGGGVVKWLTQALHQRVAFSMTSAEMFVTGVPRALAELMHAVIWQLSAQQQTTLQWYAHKVCASGKELAFVLIGIYLDEASFSSARGIYLDLGGTDVCKRSFHVLRDGGLDSGDQSCEGNHAAVSSLAEVLKSAGVSMRPARVRQALLSLLRTSPNYRVITL